MMRVSVNMVVLVMEVFGCNCGTGEVAVRS